MVATETELDTVDMVDADADVATTDVATPTTATTATTTKYATITPMMCATNTDITSTTTTTTPAATHTVTSTAANHADVVAEDTEVLERDLLSSLMNQHTSSKPQKFLHTSPKMSVT